MFGCVGRTRKGAGDNGLHLLSRYPDYLRIPNAPAPLLPDALQERRDAPYHRLKLRGRKTDNIQTRRVSADERVTRVWRGDAVYSLLVWPVCAAMRTSAPD